MDIQYINLLDLIKSTNINLIKSQYLNLLSMLTVVENMSDDLFIEKVNNISKIGMIIIAYTNEIIIGSGTIIIEQKIIRGGKNVGHIEDIVVHQDYRGKGICHNILNKLKDYAIDNNCYKIILDCDDNIKEVYEKNGFVCKGLQMAIYL